VVTFSISILNGDLGYDSVVVQRERLPTGLPSIFTNTVRATNVESITGAENLQDIIVAGCGILHLDGRGGESLNRPDVISIVKSCHVIVTSAVEAYSEITADSFGSYVWLISEQAAQLNCTNYCMVSSHNFHLIETRSRDIKTAEFTFVATTEETIGVWKVCLRFGICFDTKIVYTSGRSFLYKKMLESMDALFPELETSDGVTYSVD